jgi:hypothetical protein
MLATIIATRTGDTYRAARQNWSDCDNRDGLLGHPLFGASYTHESLDDLASFWGEITDNPEISEDL